MTFFQNKHRYNPIIKGMMQKRVALFVVGLLLLLALIPTFCPVEDECLLKDSSAHRAYDQLSAAFNTAYDFDCNIGWTRTSSTFVISWYLPSVLHSSAETRAPPA